MNNTTTTSLSVPELELLKAMFPLLLVLAFLNCGIYFITTGGGVFDKALHDVARSLLVFSPVALVVSGYFRFTTPRDKSVPLLPVVAQMIGSLVFVAGLIYVVLR